MNIDYVMDNQCFACGSENNNGLHMTIIKEQDGVKATFRIPAWAQSYKNTVHGGIIATVLDEMVVWAAYHRGYKCVTAELCIRIRNTMDISGTYRASARVIAVKHRLVKAVSEIVDSNSRIVASADAKLMSMS